MNSIFVNILKLKDQNIWKNGHCQECLGILLCGEIWRGAEGTART